MVEKSLEKKYKKSRKKRSEKRDERELLHGEWHPDGINDVVSN